MDHLEPISPEEQSGGAPVADLELKPKKRGRKPKVGDDAEPATKRGRKPKAEDNKEPPRKKPKKEEGKEKEGDGGDAHEANAAPKAKGKSKAKAKAQPKQKAESKGKAKAKEKITAKAKVQPKVRKTKVQESNEDNGETPNANTEEMDPVERARKELKDAVRARNSRKSSAYHVAYKKALAQGFEVDKAKEKAKAVLCMNWQIYIVQPFKTGQNKTYIFSLSPMVKSVICAHFSKLVNNTHYVFKPLSPRGTLVELESEAYKATA